VALVSTICSREAVVTACTHTVLSYGLTECEFQVYGCDSEEVSCVAGKNAMWVLWRIKGRTYTPSCETVQWWVNVINSGFVLDCEFRSGPSCNDIDLYTILLYFILYRIFVNLVMLCLNLWTEICSCCYPIPSY
jgi:hypothetical protein